MRYLKNLYLTWFVLLYRSGGSAWTPGINEWKGVGGVALIEWALIVSINGWIRVFSDTHLLLGLTKWEVEGLLAVLFAINYYVLVTKGIGTRFEGEFGKLEKPTRAKLFLGGLASMGIIVGFMIFSAVVTNPSRAH